MNGELTVAGVRLEMTERGRGRPILWLHGEEGLDPDLAESLTAPRAVITTCSSSFTPSRPPGSPT